MPELRRIVIAVSILEDAETIVKFMATRPFLETVEITALTVALFPLLWPVGIEAQIA